MTRFLAVLIIVAAIWPPQTARADATPDAGGSTAAVRQLVLAMSDAGFALRSEITRQVKDLGEKAVPALVEARRDPSADTRAWAGALLDAMGKRTPGDMVQTSDNPAIAEILRVYGEARDLDALPIVLMLVNSDVEQVRTAARDAVLAYGQDALSKLREAYAALLGKSAPEGATAADVAKKLFDAYDRYRLRDVYALVQQGLESVRDGRVEDAVAAFDAALARQPMLDRRSEMVGAYRTYGQSLEATDRTKALAYLRKALRVDAAGTESAPLRSEIRYLEGEDLLSRGITDTEPFEHALALDPQNQRARAELDRLRKESESSRARGWRIFAAGAVIVFSFLGILVVAGGMRRR